MKKTNRKAFTLVELVIVIAVIAILAAVMIPTFGAIIDSANKASDQSTAANLTIAISQKVHGIKTADDLHAVIVETFGEDYANSIAPKTASKGNHYWYNANTKSVVLAHYDDLDDYVGATAYVDSGVTTVNDLEGVSPFAPDSYRTMSATKGSVTNYFFLIDKGGDIGTILNTFDDEDPSNNDVKGLIDIKDSTEASEKNKSLAEAIYNRLGDISKVTDFVIKASGTGVGSAAGNYYASYHITDLKLYADGFVTDTGADASQVVTWKSNNESFATIAADGTITFDSTAIIAASASELTFTATAEAGVEDAEGNKLTKTVTVYIEYPTDVTFTLDGNDYDTDDDAIDIKLKDKDSPSFTFEIEDPTLLIGSPNVGCYADVKVTTDKSDLFKITEKDGKYILTVNILESYEDVSQTFTVTVGSAFTKTFTVTVTDLSTEPYQLNKPFDKPAFLYRVGNGNAIPLRVFFNNDQPGDDTIYIYDIVKSAGINAPIGTTTGFTATVNGVESKSGAWAISAESWAETEIKFTGTGTALIKIGEVSLAVEVVVGNNVIPNAEGNTIISSPTSGTNLVLLSDVTIADGGKLNLSSSILYGNDFTLDVKNGNYSDGTYGTDNYVVNLKNSTLNNVRIVGKAFTTFGATAKDKNNICNVYVSGDSVIANSYISGCASPVRFNGDTLEIVNTTLRGGSFANLDFRNGKLTLDNVTTINQQSVNGQTDIEGRIGLGIAIWYEGVGTCQITIKNNLTQYNYLKYSDVEKISVGSISGSSIAAAVFDSSNAAFIYTDSNGTQWVNTGILSLTDEVNNNNLIISEFNGHDSENPENSIYDGQVVSKSGFDGYLYSVKKDKVELENPGAYTTVGQYDMIPSYHINNDSNKADAQPGNNNYCTMNGEDVVISFDEKGSNGEKGSKTFKLEGFMTASKYGKPLTLTNVYLDGVAVEDVNGTIIFDKAKTAEGSTDSVPYELKFVFDDPYNYNSDGTTKAKTFTKTVYVTVNVVAAAAQHAEFSFNGTAGKEVGASDGKTYISANVNVTSSSWGSIIVGGQTIYYPIVEAPSAFQKQTSKGNEYQAFFPVFKDIITITDYADAGLGDAVIYQENGKNTTMPEGLTLVKGYAGYQNYTGVSDFAGVADSKLSTYGANKVFQWSSENEASSTPKYQSSPEAYCYATPSNLRRSGDHYWIVQYSYTDNVGATYYYYVGYVVDLDKAKDETSCLVEGTLITMADGTQKPVEELNLGDMVLAFNHETGKFVPTPVIFNTHVNDLEAREYDVLHLEFSNGEKIEIVESHGLFDMTLMKYVYIDYDNYADYIGHKFFYAGADGTLNEHVTLENAYIEKEVTRVFCPVTYFNMNSIANGFLNAPNSPYGIAGPVNYFDYDPDLKYNEEKMQADIEKYGLYTYEDFKDYMSEEAFNSSTAVYLKIAEAKGLITYDEIIVVINYLLEGSLIK